MPFSKDFVRKPTQNVWAVIDSGSKPEDINIQLCNHSGHREKFHVTGVLPSAVITLDGNTDYDLRAILDIEAFDSFEQAVVEVWRAGEAEDTLLATQTIPR